MAKLSWSNEVKEETLKCLDVNILKEELFNIVNYYKTDRNKLTDRTYEMLEEVILSAEINDLINLIEEQLENKIDIKLKNKEFNNLEEGIFIISNDSIEKAMSYIDNPIMNINVYSYESVKYEEYLAKFSKLKVIGEDITDIGNGIFIQYIFQTLKNNEDYTLNIHCYKAVLQYTGYSILNNNEIIPFKRLCSIKNKQDFHIQTMSLKELGSKRRRDIFRIELHALGEIIEIKKDLVKAIKENLENLSIKTNEQAAELMQQIYGLEETSLPDEILKASEKIALVDKILRGL